MIRLETLKEAYGLTEARWASEGHLLTTDRGDKRLETWTDTELLRWHTKWRHDVNKRCSSLLNRMIHTQQGEEAMIVPGGWLTVHDEITSLFSYQGKEEQAGELFAAMLKTGEDRDDTLVESSRFSFSERDVDQLPSSSLDRFGRDVFQKLAKEAKNRLDKANQLLEKVEYKEPVIDPIQSLSQGREVFQHLYWVGTTERPEPAFRSFRRLFSEWIQKYGEESLFRLLDAIDRMYPISEEVQQRLLAETLKPYEFEECVRQLEKSSEQEEASIYFESLNKEWDEARSLLEHLQSWMAKRRELIAT
ncbi:hypothetical protein [Texcoconibacillus texcoconensis]|uniref:Exonuclease VII small subunit n=1 Tax=Texcoconibacillus texcoconensis TaxID=1095777 RepID=A0A840QSC7_9BACI|nr:hypothetical protein [Texcoconibacillus texcoconensis]MBB5174412.1 exonuclease VII small subunit [Texcoconibacillus texcoconensis]